MKWVTIFSLVTLALLLAPVAWAQEGYDLS